VKILEVDLSTYIIIINMCGIIVVRLLKQQNDIDKICDGYNMLINRGPDKGVCLIGTKSIIGFRRLAVMDNSPLGMQPFYHRGAQLVCNGEIYNHKYLEDIHKITCVSNSDCECILHLFFLLGFEKMVQSLNGDFAFVISCNNNIYYARDRVGVRPLFEGITFDGNIALASYSRALTSFCNNIKPVIPGWGTYDNVTGINKHTEFPLTVGSILLSNVEKTIRETLTLAIKDRLMSDRPIGCLLSGGLDSSLITSIICKLIGPDKVRTYSIGMEGSKDLYYAKQVATYLGTTHTEILFNAQEGFDIIPHVIKDLESYDITTIRASVAMWLGAKYISQNTTDIVLFSGEGADELFCGYLYFHNAPSSKDIEEESNRLIKNLHLYDVLRADRCVSSHGLELRVPFLDRRIIDICQSLNGTQKGPQNGMEKAILRNAFKDNYLPNEILWRRKDGMSDGVSGDSGKKWYEQISDFVKEKITEAEFEPYIDDFPSMEAYYYKKIYDNIFPTYQPIYDYWLPKWTDHKGDPSGRNISIFNT
jgi:asparagine synthase (glutamine-hydrolysing)